MVTRIESLLLVCDVYFVAVRAAFSYYSLSYVLTIIEFDISGTIHQFCMYGLLESVFGVNWR